jgi:hypothetical protein
MTAASVGSTEEDSLSFHGSNLSLEDPLGKTTYSHPCLGNDEFATIRFRWAYRGQQVYLVILDSEDDACCKERMFPSVAGACFMKDTVSAHLTLTTTTSC